MFYTKKSFFSFLLMVFLIIAFVLACPNGSISETDTEVITDNPVHITWTERKDDIESYRTEVDVFAMNSRKDTGAVKINSYTMTIKNINGRMYSRLDMNETSILGRQLSVISDGLEMVIFDPVSNKESLRFNVTNPIPQELDFFSNEAMLSKVNLSVIRNEALRLSFNITEDNNNRGLTLELPSHLFPQQHGERRVSTRVVFDITRELLNHTEVITYLEDGTKRTATSYPVYQEHNGTYVKTGMVHIIENDVPYRFSGMKGAKIYNSPDDYPTMSIQEYKRLAKEGLAFPAGEMFFGDPADPSYTETIVEMYRNVEINTVPNSAFRLLGVF